MPWKTKGFTGAFVVTLLDQLEAESFSILRETVAQFKKPVILFSGGKDSICVVELFLRAFYPWVPKIPVLHIDTGHNFQEVLDFRDHFIKEHGLELIVRSVEDSIRSGDVVETSAFQSRNGFQSVTLLSALREFGFDAAIGGARRDEEKARAKERIFSHRDNTGAWNPENQRPELWDYYCGEKNEGEHFRVFPISNWTEIDIWNYIAREKISLPSLYFAHDRKIVRRSRGEIIAQSPFVHISSDDRLESCRIRFRTVGDMTCTAAFESDAKDIFSVLEELKTIPLSERGSRIDDRISDSGMEDRKKLGYF